MGKIETFAIYRDSYSNENTLGVLTRGASSYGYTMEDAVRDDNIKIYGKTAIPAGIYELEVRVSPKYNEERVFIKDVVGFTGIQIHGANTADDVEGCVGASRHRDTVARTTWNSLKNDIIQIVKKAERAYLHIYQLNQK